jgi:hypothetical protein
MTSGMPTLAPLLKQITPAVVTISIKGRAVPEGNSSLGKAQRANAPPALRILRPIGKYERPAQVCD